MSGNQSHLKTWGHVWGQGHFWGLNRRGFQIRPDLSANGCPYCFRPTMDVIKRSDVTTNVYSLFIEQTLPEIIQTLR